ncbi:hypothetical protein JCGZ_12299 [Jatropha curcas]|uniref:Uncharacterized protein n=1 Tax=Jatropha curcas TaxID=180498 RepID=A0A067KA35_JATCU|nr:hypothetical protein JCGZ_12299 [Jatropha curcas]
MASASSPSLLHTLSFRRPPSCQAHAPKSVPASFTSRRKLFFLLTAAPALTARESVSIAEDIPLFGLRKKLKQAEEEAEELVREGFETAEKGLVTAEKGIETVEKGIETAERGVETVEREIEGAVSFGALAQAGGGGGGGGGWGGGLWWRERKFWVL